MADNSPKAHPEPPDDFYERSLPITEVNQSAYRLNRANYSSAIYYDRSGQGRFESKNVRVLYLGATIEAAFIETFDRRLGIRYVSREFIQSRNLFSIDSNRPLQLVDLYGSGLAKLGADSELTSDRNYQLSRSWSEAIYLHPSKVDGIRYLSRHDNTRLCWGLFERDYRLKEQNLGNLINFDEETFLQILDRYEFGSD